jgi:hypothetical protein
MFTQDDLDDMNEAKEWLQSIIDDNTRDADYAVKHWIKLEYVDKLRENANEAKSVLEEYIKLIEKIKLDCYWNNSSN